MPVRWSVADASRSWGGQLITNFDTTRTPLPPSRSIEMYFDNVSWSFSGFAVMTSLCMTSDCSDGSGQWDSSAFMAFGHGVSGAEPRLVSTADPDVYTMTGFAWSPSAGWIALGVGPDPVRYTRSTGDFSGFAWSEMIGYIRFAWLKMTSTLPKLVPHNPKVIIANHQATLGRNLGNVTEGYDPYRLSIEIWSGNTQEVKTSNNGEFSGIDLRQAKSYAYTLTDPYGNTDTGPLIVVAGAPIWSIGPFEITNAETARSLEHSSRSSTKANGYDKHTFSVNLHDTYGNPVVSVPGIKEVSYTLQFENTIKPNQTDLAGLANADEVGKSIAFTGASSSPLVDALELRRKIAGYIQSTYSVTMTGSEKDEVSVVSYLPTDDSTNNTFKYISGSVSVTKLDPAIPSVGQLAPTPFASISFGAPTNGTSYTFDKSWSGSFSLSGALGTNVFGINIPFKTNGTYTSRSAHTLNDTTEHIYRFSTGSAEYNFLEINNQGCKYNGRSDSTWCYYSSWPRWDDSWFDLTPKLSSSRVNLSFQIDHQAIRFVRLPDGDTGAYVIWSANSVDANANRGIKILGAAGGASESFFALNSSDTYTRAGDFRKPQVRDLIRQNVEEIKRIPSTTRGNVYYSSGSAVSLSAVVSSSPNVQTIILENANLTIDRDDFGSGSSSPKAIIVLGWDVIIGSGVSSIYASIYTDRGIRNDGDSTQQLYIYGTVISGNTIGTSAVASSSSPCPDFLRPSCTPEQKKQYDLNFLRIGPKTPSAGLSGRHADHPLVIEYDPRLTTDLPPGFRKVTR